MKYPALFQPLQVGAYELAHRIAMAPLTRMRATPETLAARALNADYYAQRATQGGLIVAEASQIAYAGRGGNTPGIHSPAQVAGWKEVVDAVHAKGGIIFLQLWHVGRVSHSSMQENGALPVSASNIAIAGKVKNAAGEMVDYEAPRALEPNEIPAVIESYRAAAANAKAAGFDGVEIHGANGYLLEQFLQSRTNRRTDQYGGGIANRARLLLEVAEAVVGVWGANRVAVRLSPYGVANDSGEADPMPLYTHVVQELSKHDLAFLHFIEPRSSGAGRAEVNHQGVPSACELFRPIWKGVLMTAGGFTAESANAAVVAGHADLIAFGRTFIANPDLVARVKHDAPFTPYNRATFYGGDVEGYTDYPLMQAAP